MGGYTGLVLELGPAPHDCGVLEGHDPVAGSATRMGDPCALLRWELLDEDLATSIVGSDGGRQWVPIGHLQPV